jgi:hypothetical protein
MLDDVAASDTRLLDERQLLSDDAVRPHEIRRR